MPNSAYIKTLDRSFRDKCLYLPWFSPVPEARRIEAWRPEYNHGLPNTALGNLTPAEYRAESETCPVPIGVGRAENAPCGCICMMRKKINVSTVLAGQRLGIKEVDDGIWLVSFMHYDLGYIDLEQKTLQTIDNPFGSRLSPMS
ncbi:integrase core domain-containing protein [Methylovirgula sp. 4M-Z18]|uniref:integrase core domain-containing protein n=1 Tax=Methylovirgula sp. 4M-Z18 TaxID=2293567 RepID=UPI000E2F4DB2|nr:integrase core domain-containing protein [Methylovirgula sp. 4M-Z18]RFB81073.1 hypothetical protein DYH55_06350 [Methylovirgula sp. 4M-Z18]